MSANAQHTQAAHVTPPAAPATTSVGSDSTKLSADRLLFCQRCDHQWIPRVRGHRPKRCPLCNALNWHRPARPGKYPKGEAHHRSLAKRLAKIETEVNSQDEQAQDEAA